MYLKQTLKLQLLALLDGGRKMLGVRRVCAPHAPHTVLYYWTGCKSRV